MEMKSPNFNMEDFYKVLSYLPKSRVDRQEPLDLKSKSVVRNRQVLILPTIHQDFNGTDTVELYINCNGSHIDVSALSISFSPLVNGNAPVLTLNANETEIDYDSETIVTFTLDDNATARDLSRRLTGIESIKFDFGSEVNNIDILNFVMKSKDFTYTIADLKTACENGQAYVLRRLNNMKNEKEEIKEIPDLLKQYIYMAGGAYAWLTRWEYEAKPMKEPKSESNNYADRLFTQVDDAIKKYLSNIENNRDEEYIRMDLFKTARWKW
jgi:hypothetical protein